MIDGNQNQNNIIILMAISCQKVALTFYGDCHVTILDIASGATQLLLTPIGVFSLDFNPCMHQSSIQAFLEDPETLENEIRKLLCLRDYSGASALQELAKHATSDALAVGCAHRRLFICIDFIVHARYPVLPRARYPVA